MYVGKVAFCGWAFHFGEFQGTLSFFWDEFLYIFILSLLAPFLIMGRVTYLHHYVCFSLVYCLVTTNLTFSFLSQLPTLYFAVLMLSHVLDHFIFSSRRYTKKTKNIVFGVLAFIVVLNFWWFKGVVFGIPGPIGEHKGLQWRKVCFNFFYLEFGFPTKDYLVVEYL